ncbi:alpha-xylosidase [Paenibacillus montaniterrae]|uniref:alpha-D-xyloside xylohydrolase n=1 Tax=Paenibacillus montaniterrae TaxID=429341 RepID=A0A919YSJ1_9BACL|nr:alpha-xylosidase [Paenibacillus montaniterrae]GIP17611.1 alpha-xylosidase [Paenibacillus montaniterrae]
MKFTDGNWMIREQYEVISAVEPYDHIIDNKELTVHVSPRPIAIRSNILNTPMLKVQFHSPKPGIIGVKLVHFKGVRQRGPRFMLTPETGDFVKIEETANEIIFTSGSLSAHVQMGEEWHVSFYRGAERLTGSRVKSMAYIKEGKTRTYMREELDLGVGELVYGLGERFTSFVKNGQVIDMWNKDGGTSSEQAYKNVPFYMSNKGYGVFVNHPELVSFEVASEKVKKVQFAVEGESLEYFVIDGPDMKDVLVKYTSLTGKPALPPAWSFGLWLTTSFTTNYDEQTINTFIDGMAERNLPLSVFHFDCFWMRGFHWTDFTWDNETFPDPVGMLQRLKAKGLKISVWINPYIAERSKLFDEGMEHGYLLKKANGDVWQTDMWQAGMGIVDFTNPAACEWFAQYLRDLIDQGVDSFKTDFGERIPTDVVYYDGSDPQKMHNYYAYLYNKVVFEVLEEKLGKGEAVVFARSATAGGQQFPIHWGGDCNSDYESMAESLRGGLSLGLSGFAYWSHDIGGFENMPQVDVFKRWLAFGLLSSHSRLHGSKSYRVPWVYDEEAVDVTRYFTNLKCRLMPYLYQLAAKSHEQGIPMMRAMVLEFPNDPAVEYIDRQYMLGDHLLVAPVLRADGVVRYYLPEGKWTHFISGEVIEGGKWLTGEYDFFSLPLFVRPNSIIVHGANETRPDYDYAHDATIAIYQLEDGKSIATTIYNVNGEAEVRVQATREQDHITVDVAGSGKPFSIRVYDDKRVIAMDGEAAVAIDGIVNIPAGKEQLTLKLQLS